MIRRHGEEHPRPRPRGGAGEAASAAASRARRAAARDSPAAPRRCAPATPTRPAGCGRSARAATGLPAVDRPSTASRITGRRASSSRMLAERTVEQQPEQDGEERERQEQAQSGGRLPAHSRGRTARRPRAPPPPRRRARAGTAAATASSQRAPDVSAAPPSRTRTRDIQKSCGIRIHSPPPRCAPAQKTLAEFVGIMLFYFHLRTNDFAGRTPPCRIPGCFS